MRSKHRELLQSKEATISDLSKQLTEQAVRADRAQKDKQSAEEELAKLLLQLNKFKQETTKTYDQFNRDVAEQQSEAESKVLQLQRECGRLKDQVEALKQAQSQAAVRIDEQQVKLQSYMGEYERFSQENKKLKEQLLSVRDQKEEALQEVARQKLAGHNRLTMVGDEANLKVSRLEQMLLEAKQERQEYEEHAYQVIKNSERLA